MRKTNTLLFLLAAMMSASSVHAFGLLYVPVIDAETEIRVHNSGDVSTTVAFRFIPYETESREVDVGPHGTLRLTDLVPDGGRGVLEIRAGDTVYVTARRAGLELPVTGLRSPPPAADGDCPPEALFRLDGVFHAPVRGAGEAGERAVFFVPTTAGETFSRLVLTMDFTHGGWHENSSGNHAVLWLNRSDVWRGNVLGYLNLFGPRKNIAKNVHNVELPRGVTEAAKKAAVFEPGETYAVRYVYDTAAGVVEVVVRVKGGEEVVRLVGRPTVGEISTGDRLMLVFGHTSHEAGSEVPTYGWRYANLCLRLEGRSGR